MADEDLNLNEVIVEPPQTEEPPQLTEDEQRATSKGWKPKDQWEGDENDWKPAKVFNEIGELKEKLSVQEHTLKKTNKVVQLMKEHHLNVRQSAYEQAIKDLKTQRAEALENDRFGEAEKIRDQIEDVNTRYKTDNVLPAHIEKEVSTASDPDPEYFAFMDRNAWYKPGGKDELSKEADALGAAYKLQHPEAPFKDLITDVEKKIRKLYPEKFTRPNNPVNEPGNQRGTGSSPTKYVLSAEEKEIARGFDLTDAEYAKELAGYKGR